MEQYHKIQTVFARDPATKYKTLIDGQYSKPEFAWLAYQEWIGTEKIDGTNIRIMWDGDQVRFGGKSERAQIPTHLLATLQDLFTNEKMADAFDCGDVCLYGEGYGEKIQNGGGYMATGRGTEFALFDVKIGGIWLERPNVFDVAEKLGLSIVQTIFSGALVDAVEITKKGFTSCFGNKQAEGMVLRPSVELFNRRGERVITKIKTKDFKQI